MITTIKQCITFDNAKESIHISNFREDHPDWKETRTRRYTMFRKDDQYHSELVEVE